MIGLRTITAGMVFIILAACLLNTSINYAVSYVSIVIHIELLDGTPLPNATISLIPSSDIMHIYSNNTNASGISVFNIPSPLSANLKIHLTIEYNTYGVIYDGEKTVDTTMQSKHIINIMLPYTVLNKEIRITDEYGENISGRIALIFNHVQLLNVNFSNGIALINGRMGKYILLWSNNTLFQKKYMLHVTIGNTSTSFEGIPSNLHIDIRPPRIKMLGTMGRYYPSLGIIHVELKLIIRDGVSTSKNTIKAIILLEHCSMDECRFKPEIKTSLGGYDYSQYMNVTIWYNIQQTYFAGRKIANVSFVVSVEDPGNHHVNIIKHVIVPLNTATSSNTLSSASPTMSIQNGSATIVRTINGQKGIIAGNTGFLNWIIENVGIIVSAAIAFIVLILEVRYHKE